MLTRGDGTSELASGSTNAGLTGNNTNGEHDEPISGVPENLTNRIINAGAGVNNGSASNENTNEDEEKSKIPFLLLLLPQWKQRWFELECRESTWANSSDWVW